MQLSFIWFNATSEAAGPPLKMRQSYSHSPRPACWAFSIFVKLAMSYLVQLGQYQQSETLAVLVVCSLCSARLNSYHGQ